MRKRVASNQKERTLLQAWTPVSCECDALLSLLADHSFGTSTRNRLGT